MIEFDFSLLGTMPTNICKGHNSCRGAVTRSVTIGHLWIGKWWIQLSRSGQFGRRHIHSWTCYPRRGESDPNPLRGLERIFLGLGMIPAQCGHISSLDQPRANWSDVGAVSTNLERSDSIFGRCRLATRLRHCTLGLSGSPWLPL